MSRFIGNVSAYAYAVEKGYTGTEEEFAELMASYATVGQTAVEAAQTATTKASEASQSATTATNKASEATTAAQTATNKSAEAQSSAQTASTKAGEATTAATAAQTAKTQTEAAASQALTDISTARSGAISAVHTEGATQTANARSQAQAAAQSATTASTKASEASASATSAGQSAINAAASATSATQSASNAQDVLDSIPADYSDLSEDVDQLKADLSDISVAFSPDMVNGGISSAEGNITTSSTRLVSDYVFGVLNATCDSGYKFIVAAYDNNTQSYIGMWDGTNLVKSATWFTTKVRFEDIGDYRYKFVFAKTNDTSINVSDAVHLTLTSYTDSTISKPGRAADAKAVKVSLEGLNAKIINGVISADNFIQGGFSTAQGEYYSDKRIRLANSIKAASGTKLLFSIGNYYWIAWELQTESLDGGNNVIVATTWNQDTEYVVQNDCWLLLAISKDTKLSYEQDTLVSDFGDKFITIDSTPIEVDDTLSLISENPVQNKIITGAISETNASINSLWTAISGLKNLYIGDFIQGGYSETEVTDKQNRIVTKECIALPYGDKTILKISANEGYLVGIRCGQSAKQLTSNLYWYVDGDTVTFNNNEQYFRIIVAKYVPGSTTQYEDISPSDINNVGLHVTYSANGFVETNLLCDSDEEIETYLNAANGLSQSSHGGLGSFPVICHISDVHGDYYRLRNAIDISNFCNADALIISGDIVAYKPTDGLGWMHSLLQQSKAKPVICTGNHEVPNNTYTDNKVYEYMMQPSAFLLGNSSGKTYYYTDIPNKQLRIISADIYQYGATTRNNAHMSSEQLAYICDALLTTPSGYGVLIVAHSPCVDVGQLVNSNYSTFFQSLRKYGFTHYDISGAPLYDIIDAFIARTSITRTYTQTGSPSSISVDADFSSVDSSIEFIAHLTGHIHEDSVCYLPTTQRQLMLNIECCTAMTGGTSYPYLADDCDTTRLPVGKTQNAINMYVVDRSNKKIKIIRIGATKTYDRKTRDYMEIPYAV